MINRNPPKIFSRYMEGSFIAILEPMIAPIKPGKTIYKHILNSTFLFFKWVMTATILNGIKEIKFIL